MHNDAGGRAGGRLGGQPLSVLSQPRCVAHHRAERTSLRHTGILLGKAALAALCETKGPLAGITATMTFVPYSWDQPSSLASALDDWNIRGEYVLASSEGALFEYGSDRPVIASLLLLREAGAIPTPADLVVAEGAFRHDAAGQAQCRRRCRERPDG